MIIITATRERPAAVTAADRDGNPIEQQQVYFELPEDKLLEASVEDLTKFYICPAVLSLRDHLRQKWIDVASQLT